MLALLEDSPLGETQEAAQGDTVQERGGPSPQAACPLPSGSDSRVPQSPDSILDGHSPAQRTFI